jgi:dinuclear metal center YbgI/SA1388 family protein
MKTIDLLKKLGKKFPKHIAKDHHDYVGLMAGKLPNEVNKILICLDFDEEVFEIALKDKPDLILSHHPFIYGKKEEVFYLWPNKKILYEKVIENNLVIYSMHTNFDAGEDGMNDALANALGLNNVYTPNEFNLMRIGELDYPMNIYDFAKYAKEKFNVSYSLLLPYGSELVKKIGIVGGAGSGYYKLAKKEGCDLYISGDAPHHVRREIVSDKFNYLDMPHEIEKIFIPQMKKIIHQIDESLQIICVDHEKLPEII